MNKFYETEAAINQKQLIVEQTNITETRAKLSRNVSESAELEARKIASLDEIEKSFIHGQATEEQVETARQEADAARAKLIADQRMLKHADDALKQIAAQITESEKYVKTARYQFCMAEHGRILAEINADQTLQKKLIECFAAYRANGWQYSDDWQRFINSLTFIKPDQHLIDDAVEKFHQTHKLHRQ